jgi:peptide-methionine (R)-S-oxide reductase
MVTRRFLLILGSALALGLILVWLVSPAPSAADQSEAAFPIRKAEEEWRRQLTPQQYQVLRRHATERPFSSPLNDEKRRGTFVCAACGNPLFASSTKFDSGTGWPSFWQPLPNAVGTSVDRSLLMVRTEVHCAQCGGHLGHVFNDGPKPTGLRYCINGVALQFKPT